MPFQLTIAEGQESGKAFSFEQNAITIGRTDECDVVLYDPGVSRQHARIFSEGTSYFVEDMGSANGTKVNGQAVKKHQLSEGDSVALGAVVFRFSEQTKATANGEPVVPGTRIVPADEIRKKPRAFVPDNMTAEQASALGRKQTSALSAAELNQALKKPAAPKVAPGRLSAADRARIRRESPGLVGSARIFWLNSSDGVRRALSLAGALLLLSLIALVYYLALYQPPNAHPKPPEPVTLDRNPIHESFGLGEGVDYPRRDFKMFEFDYNAATRALLIVHYQSEDISEGEVDVMVNGTSVGKLQPDTVNTQERFNELLLPSNLVKRGEKNSLTLDNVKNPPGHETWRVWNLSLETVLLPDMPLEQQLGEARDAYQRGQVAFERRDVGADSRYRAWRDFREAWLKLEAVPEPRPDLYKLARERMREAQNELDRTCRKLLLEAAAYYNQRDYKAARNTLDFIREYFPGNDQSCPFLADAKREEYGL
jgi:pSer/pThr/pTyr-binding forkhead associated (FHA) protein